MTSPFTPYVAIVQSQQIKHESGNPESLRLASKTRVFVNRLINQPSSRKQLSFAFENLRAHRLLRPDDTQIVVVTEAENGSDPRRALLLLRDCDRRLRQGATAEQAVTGAIAAAGEASSDSLASVQSELESVRTIMVANIDQVLQRGEALETLVDRTQTMNDTANIFQRRAAQVSNKFWWQNVKLLVLLGSIVGFILLILLYAFSHSLVVHTAFPIT